jgi:PE-PPE domain
MGIVMSTSNYIGRVGALAVALGVGFAVTVTPGGALAEPANLPDPPPDRTALLMGGGTVDTLDAYLVEIVKNQYVAPTHPGQDIEYVPVTARIEAWPVTGVLRLGATVVGPPEVWGPGGAGWWPDAPLWKLSGLFDLTKDQTVEAGVPALEAAMAKHGNDHLVIYGISGGAMIALAEKRKLAEQYPLGTEAPDIDFVMQAIPNVPNGGLHARFPGLVLPIGWTFDGPAPTDTQFVTVFVNRQYDMISDFPLYPINLIADLNAFLGGFYRHLYSWDDSLPADDPTESPAYQGTHGDTSYYFFETEDLPLFGPLRTLGVPESLIDVFEPFFRVIVELGYDRTIDPWEPTPARLIPPLNLATVVTDLVGAIGEGIDNALAITNSPAPLSVPAVVPARTAKMNVSEQATSLEQVAETEQATSLEPVAETAEATSLERVTDTDQAASQERVRDTDQAGLQERVTDTDQAASQERVRDTDQAGLQERETDTEEAQSENFSKSNPAKKADRSSTHRPVRDALKPFGQRIRGALQSGDAKAPTAVAPAANEGPAQAGPSSDDDPDANEADGS